jgi:phosphoribosylanthranilate isomerase
VPPEIKFCGMTREADVQVAVALGARYVGVILAGGPRGLSVSRARDLVRSIPPGVGRVGVFGPQSDGATPIAAARDVGLDVVQLHGDPDVDAVATARDTFSGPVWACLRVHGASLPELAADLFREADAVVLDSYSPMLLGGTGIPLPWPDLADALAAARGRARLVLAGGLRPETVSSAVQTLRPDVVDVSSGVELAPGVKDHAKLRAFRDAVRGGDPPP